MPPLAQDEYWKNRHEKQARRATNTSSARRRGVRGYLDALRIWRGAQPCQSHAEFCFHKILKSHLPHREDWSAIEIGCSPGGHLVTLHKIFGYCPHGVEYAESGVEVTRQTFVENGLDPENIIHADFFAPSFQTTYSGKFDVVYSWSFLEHFENANDVVRKHMNLVRQGGYFVCAIPNIKGIIYPILSLLCKDFVRAHNTGIMKMEPFRSLFEGELFETRYCGPVGVLGFHGTSYMKSKGALTGLAGNILDRGQDLFDNVMFLFLGNRLGKTRLSPWLVFIGRRL